MSSRRWDSGQVDRISDLPESIITEILNLLPTKDAVATSLLSKSWRRRWKEVTTFDIEIRSTYSQSLAEQLMGFIDMFLLNHQQVESISNFRLRWNCKYYFNSRRFNAVISAIPPTFKVLDLVSVQTTELPPEIYTRKTLEVMKLEGDFKVKLSHVVCLPKLAELELNGVNYESDKTVGALISSCPVLQSLTIKRRDFTGNERFLIVSSLSLKRLHICFSFAETYNWLDKPRHMKLRIDSPALEYLVLHDWVSKYISISSCVNEVDLDVSRATDHNMVVRLLHTFQETNSLKLSKNTMEALHRATIRPPASFKTLTKLAVGYDTSESDRVFDLMAGCVNLRILGIHGCVFNPGLFSPSAPKWSPTVIPRCFLSSLRQVICKPSTVLEVDLDMIEFILNQCLVLERVDLCFDRNVMAYKNMDSILQRVLMMPRASPTCRLFRRIGDSGNPEYIG